MFESWAALYDAIYRAKGKDYRAEAEWIAQRARVVLERARASDRRYRLLDVACGTGEHLLHLREKFDVFGVDRSAAMLEVARAKLGSSVPLIERDMADLCDAAEVSSRVAGVTTPPCDAEVSSLLGGTEELSLPCDPGVLAQPFDVVTCMFSSIGYLRDSASLVRSVAWMTRHLDPDGMLLIEPAVLPHQLRPSATSELQFEHEGRSWRRTTSARHDPPYLRIRFEYETPGQCFAEEQPIRLFSLEEYEGAFDGAGLRMEFDPVGPSGLGALVGSRSRPGSRIWITRG